MGSALADLPDLRLFKQVMDVNFYGMVYCTYYALPFLKQSRGRLVNISSLGGKMAIPFNTSYSASKYAIHGFSDSLRLELAPARRQRHRRLPLLGGDGISRALYE